MIFSFALQKLGLESIKKGNCY
jgi:hypothetical protein